MTPNNTTKKQIFFRSGNLTKSAMGIINERLEYNIDIKDIAKELNVNVKYVEEFLLR